MNLCCSQAFDVKQFEKGLDQKETMAKYSVCYFDLKLAFHFN